MPSIMDKLKKNSTIAHTEVLSESQFFGDTDVVSTDVPMINVALSGNTEGGITPGLTVLAGPSKHFKTSFALKIASSYLENKKDSVLLFYDSESLVHHNLTLNNLIFLWIEYYIHLSQM